MSWCKDQFEYNFDAKKHLIILTLMNLVAEFSQWRLYDRAGYRHFGGKRKLVIYFEPKPIIDNQERLNITEILKLR